MPILLVAIIFVIGLVAPANCQTSTQLAEARPAETYEHLKKALEEARAAVDDVGIRKVDNFVPLTSCSSAIDYIGEDRDDKASVLQLADLAFDVLYMQAVLRVAGYPESLWASDIADYERKNLAAIDKFDSGAGTENGSPEKRRLAAKLNNYKKNTKGRFKKVQAQPEGCGAGEIPVKIRTSPSAARVEYINVVKFNLCKMQGLDPRGSSCDHWLDYGASAKDGAQMSGKYKVRARWSDGTTVYRDLDVDSLVESRNGYYSFGIAKQ